MTGLPLRPDYAHDSYLRNMSSAPDIAGCGRASFFKHARSRAQEAILGEFL